MKNGTRSVPRTLLALLGILVLLLAACGGGTASTSPSSEASTPASAPAESPSASAAGEPVEIEWYVGLGTGENEE